ncbi:MAG: UDP-glucose 4-epimerase GalE [Gammaproteobacteria bacterium]|nr:UDP-glucose 4-epimerase GalE [Gammaproteobacteria bacterium]
MNIVLREAGYEPLILDDFSKGHRSAVLEFECIQGSLHDSALLERIFKEYSIEAVMHFAAFIEVGESVLNPLKYYQNNVAGTLNLLEAMLNAEVKKIIFSSTAAVYGEPQSMPIPADHSKEPLNPYGRSKWMVEQILHDLDRSSGLKSVALRYFNAAGADPLQRVGECHEPESHLIPIVLQVANGRRELIRVFGRDYDTPDGTCIRDYIHVMDLCGAHLLALDFLKRESRSAAFNLGNGRGFSVQEVINAAQKVTGKFIRVEEGQRRAGDPARLVADSSEVMRVLRWQPRYSSLEDIIGHAWAWEQRRFS